MEGGLWDQFVLIVGFVLGSEQSVNLVECLSYNLVDKEDVAFTEVREDSHQIAGFLEHGA